MNPSPTPLPKKEKAPFKFGVPRKVKQATLAGETFWPGKLGAEVNLNPAKYPKMKMLYVPGEALYLEWEDGSLYGIGIGNIKGMEFED